MNGDWPGELKPKRVVFPMAGKGGVGKTTVMATLAEWYASNGFKVAMFDMDPDNKAEGSLFSFFPDAHKLPALENWTYDKLLGVSLDSEADIVLADMGAAQGHRMIPWFRDFYRVMQDSGIPLRWTAIGVVDTDIASARSVLDWGEALQDGVDYLIVHNHHRDDARFCVGESSDCRASFRLSTGILSNGDSHGRASARSPEVHADRL